MHRDVTEINVQKPGIGFSQDVEQRLELSARDLPGRVAQLSEPKAAQKMQRRFWDNVDLIEWEAARIFAFLSDDNRRDALDCRDLPVDMPHLRFEKRRAITGDNRGRIFCHVERSRDISHCSSFNSKRFLHFGRNDKIPRVRTRATSTSNFLEDDFEKLDLVVFPRERIISETLLARAVLRRRP